MTDLLILRIVRRTVDNFTKRRTSKSWLALAAVLATDAVACKRPEIGNHNT